MFKSVFSVLKGGVHVIDSLTLEIYKFKTTAGVEKYRCYMPEINQCFVELSPTGFKPILNNILVTRYAVSFKKLFADTVGSGESTFSQQLTKALSSKESMSIDYFINKKEKILFNVIYKN